LGFPSVDAGQGWLIFVLPPSELGIHPSDGTAREQAHGGRPLLRAVLYLMCSDLAAFTKVLQAQKVQFTDVEEEPWGIRTSIRLPSGGEIGFYRPTHPTALSLGVR
jgi:hypothetical protein